MAELTIRDEARICGVGVSTVSRAINNHPDINLATKEKIMRVVREPKEEMELTSIKMLLDLIEEHPVKSNQLIFGAQLQIGESTREI